MTMVKTDKDRFVALAFCWADLLLELDQDLNVVFAAGPTEAFLGQTAAHLAGRSILDFIPPADVPLIQRIFYETRLAGRIDNETVRLARKNGGALGMSLSGYCLAGGGGNFFVGLRRRAVPVSAGVAAILTKSGIYDAQIFSHVAAERAQKVQAAGGDSRMTMVVVDDLPKLCASLDNKAEFSLRQKLGGILRAVSLAGDSAGEIADGQYGVLHEPGADLPTLLKLIAQATQSADVSGVGLNTQSVSLELGDTNAISQDELAKGLLYTLNRFRESRVKGGPLQFESGGSLVSLCQHAIKEVGEFRHRLSRAQFDIALQPIVDVSSGEIHHFEALCRFRGGEAGSTQRAITMAEETGMIHEFDLAMVRKALDWLEKSGQRTRLAVNVSGFSLSQPSYLSDLTQLLQDNPSSRGKLLFEITDSAHMTNLEEANRFFQTLRQAGYQVSLDDFGAEASSFHFLSTLEVDMVKLDGSAIRTAEKGQKGRAFLTALTELCKRLGVKTIAEMIDTPERLQFCKDCGCDFVQGYLFGQPSVDIRAFNPLPQGQLFRMRQWGDSNPGTGSGRR